MEYKITSLQEFYEGIRQEAHERWDNTPISVMVFGPDISSTGISSLLRKHIVYKCSEYGILVRTEHEDFQESYRQLLGSKRNLCGLEYLAARHVDALVMIPDSPGSFIELGMFSLAKEVCEKTLILFSKAFSSPDNQFSFVFLGPKLAYKERKAKIEFVDYTRTDLAWKKVYKFLRERRALKWEQSVYEDLL